MDHLKEGIGLRGYAQQNPLQEYKKEGFEMFEELVRRLESDVVEKLMSVQIQQSAAGGRAAQRAVEGAPAPVEMPRQVVDLERRQRQAQQPQRFRLSTASAGRAGQGRDHPPRRRQGRPQRSLPVRQREEVQEVPRGAGVSAGVGRS